MACYSFANCAVAGAPYLTPLTDIRIPFANMRTEGIVTLLSGQPLELHPVDKATLLATQSWRQFIQQDPNINEHDNFEQFGSFAPLTVTEEDTFLWTPFVDCNCSLSQARCTNGNPYPYVPAVVKEVFPSASRTDLTTVEKNWQRMIDALAHVQHKGVVLYPTDNTLPIQAELARRNTAYNARATDMFSAQGWQIFSITPEPKQGDPYWAHYSDRSRQILQDSIAQTFRLTTPETSISV